MNAVKPLLDFSFSTFITTRIARVLYTLAVVLVIVGASLAFLSTVVAAQGVIGTAGALIIGLPIAIVSSLVVLAVIRIWLEITVVLFRIAENVQVLAGATNTVQEREHTPSF